MLNKIILAVALGVASILPAQAMSISSAARNITGAIPARTSAFSERTNFSYQLFCLQYGTECRPAAPGVIAYTNKVRTVLASVNRTVNQVMPGLRAQREFLSLRPLPAVGDDYAMMKRGQLIRAGLPAGAMRLATVVARDGRNHSVLVIVTSHGEFVLDHHLSTVLKRRDTGYTFASLGETRFFD